jgi:hypothetical protein
VRRLLLDSADDDTQRIGYFLDQQTATEMDYISARRNLEDVLRKVDAGELPSGALRKAEQQYEMIVRMEFFEPAILQAIGNTAAPDRGARFVLAELERKILLLAPTGFEPVTFGSVDRCSTELIALFELDLVVDTSNTNSNNPINQQKCKGGNNFGALAQPQSVHRS